MNSLACRPKLTWTGYQDKFGVAKAAVLLVLKLVEGAPLDDNTHNGVTPLEDVCSVSCPRSSASCKAQSKQT